MKRPFAIPFIAACAIAGIIASGCATAPAADPQASSSSAQESTEAVLSESSLDAAADFSLTLLRTTMAEDGAGAAPSDDAGANANAASEGSANHGESEAAATAEAENDAVAHDRHGIEPAHLPVFRRIGTRHDRQRRAGTDARADGGRARHERRRAERVHRLIHEHAALDRRGARQHSQLPLGKRPNPRQERFSGGERHALRSRRLHHALRQGDERPHQRMGRRQHRRHDRIHRRQRIARHGAVPGQRDGLRRQVDEPLRRDPGITRHLHHSRRKRRMRR